MKEAIKKRKGLSGNCVANKGRELALEIVLAKTVSFNTQKLKRT